MDQDQLLSGLNEPQQQAVRQIDGPLLVIAGAGSGKTRVITRRVAWMTQEGIAPWSILAITFTNKAAGEMRQRVAATMGRRLRDYGQLIHDGPTICTFHSLCLRILKHYAVTVGLQPNFSVLDIADQHKLVKQAVELCQIDAKSFSVSQLHSGISSAKNKLITPEQYTAIHTDFVAKRIGAVYAKYQMLLRKNNAADFDDLLMLTALAFRNHAAMLSELQERFAYILVDEYQDTNHAQYIIAHALALKHRNICVVGDPDQSIYAWRGADIRNILDFEKDYPDATVIRLEQNYRSSKRILAIASKLIEHNTERRRKSLWTENDEGAKAKVLVAEDERDEAQQVVAECKRLNEQDTVPWNQMAIFYRINAMSRVMEDALRRAAIPYEIARGVEFYGRKEIKDVLAYLRLIINPCDEVSLSRIINTPTRGLGDNGLRLMQTFATGNQLSLMEVLLRAGEIPGLSKKAVTGSMQLGLLFRAWRKMAGVEPGDEISASIQGIIETVVKQSGLEGHYNKKKADDQDVEGTEMDNVNELINAAAQFDEENPQANLEAYLTQVSLVSDADHRGSGGAVTMMTLHAAKGLEFPVVAIIGLEEGILPHERARDNPAQLEEERRLCFVGVTRAQQRLILSRARNRSQRGMSMRQVSSPFLREMPEEHLEIMEAFGGMEGGYGSRDWSAPPSERSSPKIKPGQMVRHPSFGVGKVSDVNAMGDFTRVVVDFTRSGRKTLVMEYAKLELLG